MVLLFICQEESEREIIVGSVEKCQKKKIMKEHDEGGVKTADVII